MVYEIVRTYSNWVGFHSLYSVNNQVSFFHCSFGLCHPDGKSSRNSLDGLQVSWIPVANKVPPCISNTSGMWDKFPSSHPSCNKKVSQIVLISNPPPPKKKSSSKSNNLKQHLSPPKKNVRKNLCNYM